MFSPHQDGVKKQKRVDQYLDLDAKLQALPAEGPSGSPSPHYLLFLILLNAEILHNSEQGEERDSLRRGCLIFALTQNQRVHVRAHSD